MSTTQLEGNYVGRLSEHAALEDWHMATYHKHAKEWAAAGAIMPEVRFSFYDDARDTWHLGSVQRC